VSPGDSSGGPGEGGGVSGLEGRPLLNLSVLDERAPGEWSASGSQRELIRRAH